MSVSEYERSLRPQFGPHAKIHVRPNPIRVIVRCKLCKGRYTCPAEPEGFASGGRATWSLAMWTNHLYVAHQIGTEEQMLAARAHVDAICRRTEQRFAAQLKAAGVQNMFPTDAPMHDD